MGGSFSENSCLGRGMSEGGGFWGHFLDNFCDCMGVFSAAGPIFGYLANVDHFLAFRGHFKGIWSIFSNLTFFENIFIHNFRSPQKTRRENKKIISVPPPKIPPSEKSSTIGDCHPSWQIRPVGIGFSAKS